MGFIQTLFGGGAAALVDSIGNAIDKNVTTKEEKMALEMEEAKAEMAHKLDMEKVNLEETKAYLQDTSSARDMNVKVQESANASWLSKNINPVLSIGTVVLGFVLFYIFAFKKVDVQSKDIVIYILGALSSILVQIYSFHFGSSKSSHDKDLTIKDLSNK